MNRPSGRYLGTEIEERWWRRFTRDGLFARGSGKYWHDDQAFHFLRYLTKKPIVIPFGQVRAVKVGTWHSGTWAWGSPVVKLVWLHRGQLVSSGFVLSTDRAAVPRLTEDLARRASMARR